MSVDRIIEKLKKEINNFESTIEESDFGTVIQVGDGVAKISGLDSCMASEILDFGNNVIGVALNLEEDFIGAIILGDDTKIKEGSIVKKTNKILSVPVGNDFIGRVVDPLCSPIDGLGKIKKDADYLIEREALSVIDRESVNEPLQTGIKSIDAMIPIGKGQRELIIGDRQTGKTAIVLDTIINQKDKNVICIYVGIAQKESKVARIVSKLKEAGAMDYTIIVSSGVSSSASLSYIAPYSGVALAEYFLDQGKDVLVVYDDLSKHAVSYREISLLLRRPPGREAYPGDVFYLHSRLLERACKRSKVKGGGSITALPIIETQAGDVSAYIPTNVISITDGQIFLESDLFYKGIRPAVNVGLSVSRVGGAAQIKSMKKVAGRMKLDLAQARELEAFSQFASDLDPETKKYIERGNRITEILKQNQYEPISVYNQVAIIYAVNNGYLDNIEIEEIKSMEVEFYKFLNNEKDLQESIVKGWDEKIEKELKKQIETFLKIYSKKK